MLSSRNRSIFTPTQWQELEHQALIFKYMASGVPIPPELIYSVKRSSDSSLASTLFSHQPIGWGCFQIGMGRKAELEPGRCRRTDGKKWRCSKEAFPDSKYCERHMHRGRNRSRKHVELSSNALSASTPNSSSPAPHPHQDLLTSNTHTRLTPFHCSHSSSASSGFSHQYSNTHPLSLDSGSCSSLPDHDYSANRFFSGRNKDAGDRDSFPESAGTDKNLPGLVSYKNYCHLQFQSSTDSSKQQQLQGQHCFVLGADINSAKTIKLEKEEEAQRPMHNFFGEWPPKHTYSWLDLSSNSRFHNDTS